MFVICIPNYLEYQDFISHFPQSFPMASLNADVNPLAHFRATLYNNQVEVKLLPQPITATDTD